MAKAAKSAGTRARSKSEMFRELAASSGVSRKQVAMMFDGLTSMIKKDLTKGPGVFQVPGLMKITVIRKPATKGGMRPNPFKPGEMMKVAPKPARKVVKVRALKALKAMV